jgi:hypothetical protein
MLQQKHRLARIFEVVCISIDIDVCAERQTGMSSNISQYNVVMTL